MNGIYERGIGLLMFGLTQVWLEMSHLRIFPNETFIASLNRLNAIPPVFHDEVKKTSEITLLKVAEDTDTLFSLVLKFKLTMCRGLFPQGAAKGLGEIQIFAKYQFKSYIFSSKQRFTILYNFPVGGSGLMYLSSGRLTIFKCCSNFLNASLKEGLAGKKEKCPLT